jgi:hypothetical protein
MSQVSFAKVKCHVLMQHTASYTCLGYLLQGIPELKICKKQKAKAQELLLYANTA